MTSQAAPLRRSTRIAFAALALASAVACLDEPLEVEADEDEPDVASIHILTEDAQATVSADGEFAQSGTITLRRNAQNLVVFHFRRADLTEDPVIAAHRDEFELRPSPLLPTSLTFTPVGGSGATFIASITPTVAGQVTIPFVLYNAHHGHPELSRFVVATVAP